MSAEEILDRLTAHASGGLIYYASALNKLRSGEWRPDRPFEEEERSLFNAMYALANVIAFLEGAPNEHAALRAREEIVERFLRLAAESPWTPPPVQSEE